MKLEKLIIENITSLPNAKIDFTNNPLRDCGLFLISGDIGAGKSTILDCICVALFNKTPRLEHWEASDKKGEAEIRQNSTQQLLRRGAGSGVVKLSFIGEDGKHYLAEWGIRRARGKADGKIQTEEWQLTYEENGSSVTISKKSEVASRINEIIGLDFSQFCRTTMLAQGAFTCFLNSKNDEKAEILEKITGTEIYAEVGRKIFREISSRTAQLEDLKKKIGVYEPLADDVRKEKDETLTRLKKGLAGVSSKRDEATKIKEWLVNEQTLDSELEKVKMEINLHNEQLNLEESRERREIVDDLNSTEELRSALILLDMKEAQLRSLYNEKGECVDELAELVAAISFHKAQLERKRTEMKNLETSLVIENSIERVYANSETIIALLKSFSSDISDYKSVAKSLELKKSALNDVKKNKQNAAEIERNKAQENRAAADEKVENLEKEVAKLGLAELRAEKDELNTEIPALNDAKTAVAQLENTNKLLSNLRERCIKVVEEGLEIRKEFKQCNETLARAKRNLEQKETHYQRMSDTMEKWTVHLRNSLHEGDSCPVCGAIIGDCLPDEENLSALIREAKEMLEDARTEYDDAQNVVNDKSLQYESKIEAFRLNREEMQSNDNIVDLQKTVETKFAACGIKSADEIDNLIKSKTKRVADIDVELKKGAKKEGELNSARTLLRKGEGMLREANDKLQKVNDSIAGKEKEIVAEEGSLKQIDSSIAKNRKLIGEYISGVGKYSGWEENPEASADSIRVDAEKHTEAQNKCDKIKQEIKSENEAITLWEKSTKDTATILEIETPVATGKEGDEYPDAEILSNRLNKLYGESQRIKGGVSLLLKDVEGAKTKITRQKDLLKDDGKNLTEERLAHLQSFSDKEIEEMKSKVKEEKEKSDEYSNLLSVLNTRKSSHKARKPEMPEGTTVATCESEIDGYNNYIEDINRQIGHIESELKADDEKMSKIKNLRDKYKGIEEEVHKWEQLSVLSDAEGKRFRRVAQSFVLDTLIHGANQYMDKLSGRYELSVVPGTFIINVQDRWDGYSERAASTISGGESFLVSLALALALTDFSGIFSVDTLFIDEGFGSLSGNALQQAIDTLRELHKMSGRRVGIISHITALKENIDVRIDVKRVGNSSASRLNVIG